MKTHNKILIITGPTATGKSALAVEVAKLINAEVISADSRQIYTGLDIGSAKITPQEMQGIPHHLIDIAHPHEYFSVADFQKMAQQKISEIHARGKFPIICGGTGMYIDATVFDTRFPEVTAAPELRKELGELSVSELLEKLIAIDPNRANTIDPHNKVRLIRAIEIVIHSPSPDQGRVGVGSLLSPETQPHLHPPLIRGGNYTTLWIGLNLPKEILQERIITRINNRIPALFDEIKKLSDSGISYERLHSFGLEYRYGSEYVQGKITLEQCKELLATKTWQFAKRQMTWFKRNPEIHWYDPITDQQKILKQVQEFLR